MIQNKFELGTDEYLEKGLECLKKEIELVTKAYSKLPDTKDSQSMVLSTLAYQVIETTHSLIVLSTLGKLGDCYALARIIFDHILNIGYIGAGGEQVLEKATKHAHQKVFRDLDRKITIKDMGFGIGLKNIENIEISDKLNAAISEFTSSRGTELRNWTDTNIFKKIEMIRDKYGWNIGQVLVINLFYIYRHASEIIHGSFFGALFTKGLAKPNHEWPKNHNEMQKFIKTYLGFIIQNVILLNSVMMRIIHHHYPMNEDIIQLDSLIDDYKNNV